MLKIAPMSKASITPQPTQNPATIVQSQGWREEGLRVIAARARKLAPKQIGCEATPHAAVEKKSEFSMAAIPATTQATMARPNCRRNTHAESPTTSTAIGQ